jgi:hypothetical protein
MVLTPEKEALATLSKRLKNKNPLSERVPEKPELEKGSNDAQNSTQSNQYSFLGSI